MSVLDELREKDMLRRADDGCLYATEGFSKTECGCQHCMDDLVDRRDVEAGA